MRLENLFVIKAEPVPRGVRPEAKLGELIRMTSPVDPILSAPHEVDGKRSSQVLFSRSKRLIVYLESLPQAIPISSTEMVRYMSLFGVAEADLGVVHALTNHQWIRSSLQVLAIATVCTALFNDCYRASVIQMGLFDQEHIRTSGTFKQEENLYNVEQLGAAFQSGVYTNAVRDLCLPTAQWLADLLLNFEPLMMDLLGAMQLKFKCGLYQALLTNLLNLIFSKSAEADKFWANWLFGRLKHDYNLGRDVQRKQLPMGMLYVTIQNNLGIALEHSLEKFNLITRRSSQLISSDSRSVPEIKALVESFVVAQRNAELREAKRLLPVEMRNKVIENGASLWRPFKLSSLINSRANWQMSTTIPVTSTPLGFIFEEITYMISSDAFHPGLGTVPRSVLSLCRYCSGVGCFSCVPPVYWYIRARVYEDIAASYSLVESISRASSINLQELYNLTSCLTEDGQEVLRARMSRIIWLTRHSLWSDSWSQITECVERHVTHEPELHLLNAIYSIAISSSFVDSSNQMLVKSAAKRVKKENRNRSNMTHVNFGKFTVQKVFVNLREQIEYLHGTEERTTCHPFIIFAMIQEAWFADRIDSTSSDHKTKSNYSSAEVLSRLLRHVIGSQEIGDQHPMTLELSIDAAVRAYSSTRKEQDRKKIVALICRMLAKSLRISPSSFRSAQIIFNVNINVLLGNGISPEDTTLGLQAQIRCCNIYYNRFPADHPLVFHSFNLLKKGLMTMKIDTSTRIVDRLLIGSFSNSCTDQLLALCPHKGNAIQLKSTLDDISRSWSTDEAVDAVSKLAKVFIGDDFLHHAVVAQLRPPLIPYSWPPCNWIVGLRYMAVKTGITSSAASVVEQIASSHVVIPVSLPSQIRTNYLQVETHYRQVEVMVICRKLMNLIILDHNVFSASVTPVHFIEAFPWHLSKKTLYCDTTSEEDLSGWMSLVISGAEVELERLHATMKPLDETRSEFLDIVDSRELNAVDGSLFYEVEKNLCEWIQLKLPDRSAIVSICILMSLIRYNITMEDIQLSNTVNG
eukprot:GHVH01006312.1.p1 GENE.GHVH01006312.1~~GHVH01006312.1.p1  ORF type:complete len:1030 (+),score=113.35 GHVH01006312.1:2121-5210(+)